MIVESVTGVNLEALSGREARGLAQPLKLARLLGALGIGVRPGVQLDHRHAGARRAGTWRHSRSAQLKSLANGSGSTRNGRMPQSGLTW